MAALNKLAFLKEHKLIRFWGVVIWLLGLTIFLFFSYISWMGSLRFINAPPLEFFGLFLKGVLFFPGFIPLVVGGFFLVFFQRSQDFALGAFVILPAFIVLHYVVAVIAAHDEGLGYMIAQLIEIICAVAVIYKYRKKWSSLDKV